MKTFLALVSISALGAYAFSSLSFESATSALFALGFAGIALSDYSRKAVWPLATKVAVAAGGTRSERFGLAA